MQISKIRERNSKMADSSWFQSMVSYNLKRAYNHKNLSLSHVNQIGNGNSFLHTVVLKLQAPQYRGRFPMHIKNCAPPERIDNKRN